MSIASVNIILTRISVTNHDSPIAVFKTGNPKTPYNAVFANTAKTSNRISRGDPALIGTFFGKGGAEAFFKTITGEKK